MTQTLFFSWQADTPTRIGRNFLKEVLDEVCELMAADTSINEAPRDFKVDSDTQGTPGQPPIVDTIFRKIDASSLYIGDMTFVGKRRDKRPMPNPNVLIEYGWALKSKTHERVLLVMNTTYGKPSEKNLPFNLRHIRWPVCYELHEESTPDEKAKVKAGLVKALTKAIRVSLETIPPAPKTTPKSFPQAEEKDGPARFRARGEAVGIEEGFPFGGEKEIRLAHGPAIWFRLMPLFDTDKRWPAHELKKHVVVNGRLNLDSLCESGGASQLRAEDGIGMYPGTSREESKNNEVIETDWTTFAFNTGEVWAVDTSILSMIERLPYIEDRFIKALVSYSRFIKSLGIEPPYRWIAGMVGVKGRKMTLPPARPNHAYFENAGPKCVSDVISAEGTYDGAQSPTSALRPIFDKYFEACGWQRPEHLPQ